MFAETADLDEDKFSRLLGNPQEHNIYSYALNNPINFVDRDGLAPNQAGASDPDVLYNEIVEFENSGWEKSAILFELSNEHAVNKNRYFYTDKYKWVDVRHFTRAAAEAMTRGSALHNILEFSPQPTTEPDFSGPVDIRTGWLENVRQTVSGRKSDERFKETTTIVMTADIYTAKELEGHVEHVLLKTHGITNLRNIATRIHPDN